MARKTRDWTLGDILPSWERTKSILGGGGPDPANVSSHPGADKLFAAPEHTSDDKRSTLRKIGDELLGKTVGGNSPRYKKTSPGTVKPGPGKKVTKRTTTTVTPTRRPETPQASVKPTSSVRAVQSWHGGDVPQQVRYDPGTKPNLTKKQRAGSGPIHDFKGLKGFFK